jgi:uncharacterized integral membrane protein
MTEAVAAPVVFEGAFGPYTITDADKRGVLIYRLSLLAGALSLLALVAVWWLQGQTSVWLTPLFFLMALSLGISLLTIHIYLRPLHRLLQLFWLVGTGTAVVLTVQQADLLGTLVAQPANLWGIGFLFVALTGLYFKEAFCFRRSEAKLLTFLVPVLLLGHLTGGLPEGAKAALLVGWAGLFLIFALRKFSQTADADIGDKSVFDHLEQQRQA